MNKLTKDYFSIIFIYIIIALSGWLTWSFFKHQGELISFLLADLVMTVVCFVFSVVKKNSSVYDAYWSVIPFYFILMWFFIHTTELHLPHIITFIVVSIWSWRLSLNWARGWNGYTHEDWRYINLAKKTKTFYPAVNFLGIHLFPTLIVFAGMLPLFFIFKNELISNFYFFLGIVVSLSGATLQYFSDNELARFRNRPNPVKGEILESGLWGIIRYPNYLGEMLFWIGLSLIGYAYQAPTYTFCGALAMIGLFLFISIPMKERRMKERRTNYSHYKQRVPMLIPRFIKQNK